MDLSGDKHLTIFGCGYVGTAVARQAIARGMRVTALTRNPVAGAALEALGARVVVADLAEKGWIERVPGRAEFVLNTVSGGGGGLDSYRRSYVEGMRSILEWGRAHGPVGTFVYTSSTSVYPQGGGAVVDERAGHEGAEERGRILLEAEKLLRENAAVDDGGADSFAADVARRASAETPLLTRRTSGLLERGFVLRLAGIYGPGRHSLLDQVRTGMVAGVGEHRLNLAFLDDICRAIWAAFDAPPEVVGGIFNVADDRPAPKREVVQWLAARLGVPPPTFTGTPAGSRRAVTPDRIISNVRLKTVLGWRPLFPDYRAGYENILSQRDE